VADNLTDDTNTLLREIRDLLVPISDHYRDEYEQRQSGRLSAKRERIRELLSTPARQRAWALADGSRSQREISREAGLDEGSTSKFFKALRDMGAIDGPNPKRTMEVT
jgi:hypothetical protein